jgi:hypothetical protein
VKLVLWGGPLDGAQLEIDLQVTDSDTVRVALADPASPGNKVIYQQTRRMKGRRHVFRIVQAGGC